MSSSRPCSSRTKTETLNRYTHTPDDYAARVLAAFDGSAASLLPLAGETPDESTLDEDGDAP